jgi:hypothetical protein
MTATPRRLALSSLMFESRLTFACAVLVGSFSRALAAAVQKFVAVRPPWAFAGFGTVLTLWCQVAEIEFNL